jgi:hypothetical protein
MCCAYLIASYPKDLVKLQDHHHRMLESMSPASTVAAMATAMLPQTTDSSPLSTPGSLSSSSSVTTTTVMDPSMSSSSSSSSSSEGQGLLDDILPSDPNETPWFIFSMNSELERLTGYHRDEFRQRIESYGWKMVFMVPPTNRNHILN